MQGSMLLCGTLANYLRDLAAIALPSPRKPHILTTNDAEASPSPELHASVTATETGTLLLVQLI
jgi:hypothetical protein